MCYICENKNSAGESALCKNWEFNSVALLYKNHGISYVLYVKITPFDNRK